MAKEFPTPGAFGQAYTGKEMSEKGTVVQVVSLDTLPPHFLERMPGLADKPDGYVLKRYRSRSERQPDGEAFTAWEELAAESDIAFFEHDAASTEKVFPLSTHDFEKLTEIDVITILKRRQAELVGLLDAVLPGAVIKSEFFLAPDQEGKFSIYELQEKIPPYLDLSQLKQQMLANLRPEQKTKLRTQLEVLVKKIETLSKKETVSSFYQRFIPDLNVKNVAVTNQGEVKLYDTNVCHPREDVAAQRILFFTRETLKEMIQALI